MRPLGAVLHGVDNVGHVLLALEERGIAGMLVVGAERLDETDRRQVAGLEVREEIDLVLEVGFAARAVGREVVEIGERLVVPLEIWSNLGGIAVRGSLHGL